ncbi:hypothetical protein [Aquibium microcysteis]|uniref:hypothetical protein n=1 Tax=Aquibium microcysteis TaxID=675281 RepID=UPI00165CFB42|nr:hypothetical protein [Aquibium microcysteis]
MHIEASDTAPAASRFVNELIAERDVTTPERQVFNRVAGELLEFYALTGYAIHGKKTAMCEAADEIATMWRLTRDPLIRVKAVQLLAR